MACHRSRKSDESYYHARLGPHKETEEEKRQRASAVEDLLAEAAKQIEGMVNQPWQSETKQENRPSMS